MHKAVVLSFTAILSLGISLSSFSQSVSNKNDQRCNKPFLNLIAGHLGYKSLSYESDSRGSHAVDPLSEVGLITAGACKVWPKNTSITIGAIAYAYGENLSVFMIDNIKNKIIATYQDDNSVGMRRMVYDLRIDTARYDLTPDIRAFGIDITANYGSNCGEGYTGPARTLFVQYGQELRPVLEEFYIWSARFIKGGNPHCVGAEAAAETEQEFTYRTIGIGNKTANGYTNLVVTETNSNKAKKPAQYELCFDGKKYSECPLRKAPQ